MSKKLIVFLMVAILSLTIVLTACNKDKYTDPSTGGEFILVTDENGEKVLAEDGELLVFVTDENGKKVEDESGNYVTEVHGFVGQIEQNGVVEDYAYYFTLPSGWKTVNDRGEFENKGDKSKLQIQILEMTMNDNLAKLERVYKVLTEKTDSKEAYTITKNEYDNEKVGKIYAVSFSYDGVVKTTLSFENNGNVYQIDLETEREISLEDLEKEAISLLDSIKFKPYAYYEGLTDAPTTTVKAEVQQTEQQ